MSDKSNSKSKTSPSSAVLSHAAGGIGVNAATIEIAAVEKNEKVEFERCGVKLALLRKIREISHQKQYPYWRDTGSEEIVYSNKMGWSVEAISNVLLGSSELLAPDCRWKLEKGGRYADPEDSLTGKGGRRCSLVELLRTDHYEGDSNRHPDLGVTYKEVVGDEANLFVSFIYHAQALLDNQNLLVGNFSQLVEALEHYFKVKNLDEETTFLWFEPVLSNMWNKRTKTAAWCATYKEHITRIGHTVLVLYPWDGSRIASRLWCLFEAFMSMDAERDSKKAVSFGIATTPLEEMAILGAMKNHAEEVFMRYEKIDVSKADCWDKNDRTVIRAYMERTPGSFTGVNRRIIDSIKRWMMSLMLSDLVRLKKSVARLEALDEVAVLMNQSYNSDKDNGELKEQYCTCLRATAKLCDVLGDIDGAVRYGEECLQRVGRILGDKNAFTLRAMTVLVSYYLSKQNVKAAVKLAEEALPLHKQVFGESHPDTLLAMGNLSNCYHSNGEFAKAIPIGEDCYKKRQTVLGVGHLHTLNTLNNLATSYHAMGDIPKGIKLAEECVELHKKYLGESHRYTLATMNNLNAKRNWVKKSGDLEKLLSDEEELFKKRKRLLGMAHPDTLVSMGALATFLHAKGDIDRALSLGEECWLTRKQVLGESHTDTVRFMGTLATINASKGYLKRAITLGEECTAKTKLIHGELDDLTLESINMLSIYYREKGDLEKAIEILKNNVVVCRKALGDAHVTTAKALKLLVQVRKAQVDRKAIEESKALAAGGGAGSFRGSLVMTREPMDWD